MDVVRKSPAVLQPTHLERALGKRKHTSRYDCDVSSTCCCITSTRNKVYFLFFLSCDLIESSGAVIAVFCNLRGYMGKYKSHPRFRINFCSVKMLASKTNKVLAVMDTRGSNRTSMINVW
jgi:hypothetical protein